MIGDFCSLWINHAITPRKVSLGLWLLLVATLVALIHSRLQIRRFIPLDDSRSCFEPVLCPLRQFVCSGCLAFAPTVALGPSFSPIGIHYLDTFTRRLQKLFYTLFLPIEGHVVGLCAYNSPASFSFANRHQSLRHLLRSTMFNGVSSSRVRLRRF
uniref:Secreted protein n=1 Tax=Panagrellus redivivus TaxID=6233 RepID=A0A7E4UVC0_PANRE